MPRQLLQGRPLHFAQAFVRHFQRLPFAQVGENLFGVGEVTVNVVEIGEHHFAPIDEIVQRIGLLTLRNAGSVAFVQRQDERYPVGLPHPGAPPEKAVYRLHRRQQERPRRRIAPLFISQILPEKEHRTPVRKNKKALIKVRPGIIMRRHLLQERSHTLTGQRWSQGLHSTNGIRIQSGHTGPCGVWFHSNKPTTVSG